LGTIIESIQVWAISQQQLSCSKTSELDTKLQTLNNHLEKLVTMNTDLSEKLQKTIENTELVANEVHATCEAVSKNNDMSSFSWLCIVVTELTMLLSNFASFKSSSFFCSNSVLS
jgi:Mg2+ and Co2+ transporter CorA